MNKYILQALFLANLSHPSPNPKVGCVIVKHNKVVGAGYHKAKGMPHAEIEALKKAGKKKPISLQEMSMSVKPTIH